MSGFVRLPRDDEERRRVMDSVRTDDSGLMMEFWIEQQMGIEPDRDLCRAASEHLIERFDAGVDEVDLRSFVLLYVTWRESST